jgi:hypothetical protein
MQAIVVGAGLGGLACALALRRHGVDVTVVEKSREPGGRARSPALAIQGGGALALNSGPRAVYRGGPLDRLLRAHDIVPTGFSPSTRGVLGVLAGGLVPIPGNAASLLSNAWLSARAKREIGLALARLTVGALDAREHETVARWTERHARDPHARALIQTLIRVSTYDADPLQPAATALAQTRRGIAHGVTYVDGGWASLANALVAAAEARGVRFVAGRVARIERQRAHLVDGSALEGSVVVAAGLATPELTGARIVKETAVSCLDLALDALPHPDRRVTLGLDVPLYLSVHTRADDPGPLRVHAMSYAPCARADLEALLDLVQPGWRDRVLASRFLPHMIVSRALDVSTVDVPLVHDSGPALLADGVVECAERVASQLSEKFGMMRAA